MSSIVERLTEGIVNRDMRAEGHALLEKWQRTGLLEGLDSDRKKGSMARLLENQAKELLRESSTMQAGDVEGFAAVAFPIVRRVFAGLIANDLVSVQPMSLPSGLIFFLDFVFSPNIGASGTMTDRLGNKADKSIYGTDQVGSQVTGGVDLVGSLKQDLSGPRTVGARGYAYGSPTGSLTLKSHLSRLGAATLAGTTEAEKKKYLQYDPDILALSSSDDAASYAWAVIGVPGNLLTASNGTTADFDNLGAFSLTGSVAALFTGIGKSAVQVRRLTQQTGALESSNVHILMFGASGSTGIMPSEFMQVSALTTSLGLEFPIRDNITTSNAVGSVVGAIDWGLENEEQIPEIDIKVDSIAVTAQTKKLKAKWTPELGQDLNAYHNLDAEVELTSILSEQIALEIDREILADLVNGAKAATYYWSRSPGLFLNRETGVEIGAASAAPDFTGTVSEWYETLIETINDVSAQIHRKTLRGGANFIVCGPEVANILEFTAGFRASVTADDETGSVGAVKVGSLSKKFDVIVDPYFLRNVLLIGRRGSSFLESGYVYAPYVPLQTTPTIFGPEDFVPRKGVMTRYAKKMVRPDMYGLVVVRGLVGEAGATS
tara:strand:- start:4571 stop:6382 length:1812 start_codon:yes stop_codon:yes gene_type:complete